ncbi:aldehyde dehydrogenase family protein [Leeia oryzae]|uniref:aldehyde dehydrogenase family protein n=1 Tax=Leeia oryzae TaxID=356662 RepID=UPI00036D638F|nr:aldehyde dehydrogenase family protein [Leeia oryzae]
MTLLNTPANQTLPAEPFVGQMLINGRFVEAMAGKRDTRFSPAHQIAVGSYPQAQAADVDLAVKAARTAFDAGIWSEITAAERADVLLKVADLILRDLETLALQESLESGKPLVQARDEVKGTTNLWRYAAALARTLHGESYNTLGKDMLGVVLKQPIGVVAMITPWNFPLWILCQKLPFALAAGCTAVIKPSELTSGTTVMLGKLLQEAGVPDGVVNIVTGLGPDAGQPLVEHEGVDMITFTGSTRVGRAIAEVGGRQLKKVALELGGKNPQIIFPDCDWDAAVDAVVFGVYFNAGECCNSGSRILVHEAIAEQFTAAVIDKAKSVAVGDPLHPDCKVGAIVSEAQMNGILSHIDAARKAGAEVRLGGKRLPSGQGYYLEPTIITGVSPEMPVAKEEVFGPVLAVLTFKDVKDAIQLANSTCYGLSAAVWSKDMDVCLETARAIKAGTIWVNTFLDGYAELPFGGFGDSGLGRELGKSAVEDFTETKTVQLHIGPRRHWWLPK